MILASASPRRQELLRRIGCEFRCEISSAVEDNRQEIPPEQLVARHALAKAKDVADRLGTDEIVLGADTIVVMDGEVYGKPADEKDARRMLRNLAGKEHQVYTGIALVRGDETWCDVETTAVRLCTLSDREIENYVATGEPMDKAGAYAVQGIAAIFIERICGCYTNIVGLPLNKLRRLCRKAGIDF